MDKLIINDNEYSCMKCKYSYSNGSWFEPNLYCGKFNIEGNPDIIGIRNSIHKYWINNGLECNGFKRVE